MKALHLQAANPRRVVLGVYVVLAVTPFAWAASRDGFWREPAAITATLIYLVVVLAFVVKRQRWAWLALILFTAVTLVGDIVDYFGVVPLIYLIAVGAILSSRPMRLHAGLRR